MSGLQRMTYEEALRVLGKTSDVKENQIKQLRSSGDRIFLIAGPQPGREERVVDLYEVSRNYTQDPQTRII